MQVLQWVLHQLTGLPCLTVVQSLTQELEVVAKQIVIGQYPTSGLAVPLALPPPPSAYVH
jgi:hypothetical protein